MINPDYECGVDVCENCGGCLGCIDTACDFDDNGEHYICGAPAI